MIYRNRINEVITLLEIMAVKARASDSRDETEFRALESAALMIAHYRKVLDVVGSAVQDYRRSETS